MTMKKIKLNRTSQRIYKYIVDYWKKYKCPPSRRGISIDLELSAPSVVQHHVDNRLKPAGLLLDQKELIPSGLVLDFSGVQEAWENYWTHLSSSGQ